jgi:hypothetical protein
VTSPSSSTVRVRIAQPILLRALDRIISIYVAMPKVAKASK